MPTKINKDLHISLLNIIETVDKNEEQLKELIKKSIFDSAFVPEEEKEETIQMYTSQLFEMRRNIVGAQKAVNSAIQDIIIS